MDMHVELRLSCVPVYESAFSSSTFMVIMTSMLVFMYSMRSNGSKFYLFNYSRS